MANRDRLADLPDKPHLTGRAVRHRWDASLRALGRKDRLLCDGKGADTCIGGPTYIVNVGTPDLPRADLACVVAVAAAELRCGDVRDAPAAQ
jgi:hypothetical protein